MKRIKRLIRQVLPNPVVIWYRRFKSSQIQREFAKLSVPAAFTQIYESKTWGESQDFHSGSGSDPEISEQYIAFIRALSQDERFRTVVDVGCGDFRVASQFADDFELYVGVDVVDSLVERNRSRYSNPKVQFERVDAVNESIPEGDLCLVRQVLQHLSNSEILQIISKLRAFQLVVITEHWPSESKLREFNRDKIHGPDTRVIYESCVNLSEPPFSLTNVEEVLKISVSDGIIADGETIRSFAWVPTMN